MNAKPSVAKNTVRKMLLMQPFGAYFVHIFTTFFESSTEALVTPSSLMFRFDELHCAIGACGDRLDRRAREPINDCAARNQSE